MKKHMSELSDEDLLIYHSKYGEAEKAIRKKAEDNPGDITVKYRHATILARIDKLTEAEQVINELSELYMTDQGEWTSPSAEACWFAANATIVYQKVNRDLNRHLNEKARMQDSADQKNLAKNIADSLREQLGDAEHGLEKALENSEAEKNPLFLNDLGIILSLRAALEWSAGNKEKSFFEESIAAYDLAIEIDPQCVHAFNNKGLVYFEWGLLESKPKKELLYEQARMWFDKALSVSAEYVEAWLNKAAIYIRLGKYPEAKKPFLEAARRNPYYMKKTLQRLDRTVLYAIGINKEGYEITSVSQTLPPQNNQKNNLT